MNISFTVCYQLLLWEEGRVLEGKIIGLRRNTLILHNKNFTDCDIKAKATSESNILMYSKKTFRNQ